MFLAGVGIAVLLGALPHAVLWLYGGMSVVTFASYALDKSAARRDARRTPENTLHLLALLGGWPGALWAQQRLRHKTSKQPFRTIFWFTVVLNVAALGYLLSPPGEHLLRSVRALA